MIDVAWYYAIEGRQRGPVDEQTLRSLAAQGVLRPFDLVWCDGMGDWQAAETMPWLFPSRGRPGGKNPAAAGPGASLLPAARDRTRFSGSQLVTPAASLP